MNSFNYLFLDCEMGGRDLKYSLLSIGLYITDVYFNEISKLVIYTKPDDDCFILSSQGMAVNKINIIDHDKRALTYKEAKTTLYNYLKTSTNSGSVKLVPIGHGVKGDINHIIDKLISENSWYNFCTYHYIDTSVVLQYLRACGKMPIDIDGSVGSLANYFNIRIDGQLHDALTDAIITSKVFNKMVDLGK